MPGDHDQELRSELCTLVTYVGDTGDPRPLRELLTEADHDSTVGRAVVLQIECELEKWLSRGRDAAVSADVWAGLARRAAAMRLAPDDPAYLTIRMLHAQYVRRRGRPGDLELAVRLYRREWELRTQLFPADDCRISTAHANLALAIRERAAPGDLERALDMLEEETARRMRVHGSDRPFTWIAQLILAQTLIMRAEEAVDPDEVRAAALSAGEHSEAVLTGRRVRFGRSHHATLRAQLVHANALILLGRCADAVGLLGAHQRHDPSGTTSPGKSDLLLARALKNTEPLRALVHARHAVQRSIDPRRRKAAEQLVQELEVS
ncbi:hypothetical protein D0T12_28860 [Actinomadura spongiicola]|uniref:Uncharacterized protein n=1 Tax=Actinomadura spongiicola TaxID=2303421 RepID=A0A372GA80_9ACTN|nr:hypothetical protein [Actinomadura spongiicola]RFS82247.1 hypothetical protein D0T12_28860 [Actinomadura spongiicola]